MQKYSARHIGISVVIAVFLTCIFYFTLGHRSVHFVKDALGCKKHFNEEQPEQCLHDEDAKDLSRRVRVLCFIPTSERNIQTKATAVKETWAWRCNKNIFFSKRKSPNFETVELPNVKEGTKGLPVKTMASLEYLYMHHYNDADWFFKADDDTFTIVENLRYLLSHFNSSMMWYLGHHFHKHSPKGYMSGGAGYVISRAALRHLVETGLRGPALCKQFIHSQALAEDVAVGRCLAALGVPVASSLDPKGRQTFHPFNVATHLFGPLPDWYKEYSKHQIKTGQDCCSDLSITFHFVDPVTMHIMNHLIYNTRVHGLKHMVPQSESLYYESIVQSSQASHFIDVKTIT